MAIILPFEPKKETIPPVLVWNRESVPKIKEWFIQVNCYQGVEIVDGKGKYCIQMLIRDLAIQTKWIKCKKVTCEVMRLMEANDRVDAIELPVPADPNQCPGAIFYLIQKHTRSDRTHDITSLKRLKWVTEQPHWYDFERSVLYTKLDEEKFPDGILMRIAAGARQDPLSAGGPAITEQF